MCIREHSRQRDNAHSLHECVTTVCKPASSNSFVICDYNFNRFDIADWFYDVI